MGELIAQRLMLWSLPWMLLAVLGLWRTSSPLYRAFWLMSGVWVFINAVIAMAGWLGPEGNLQSLKQILLINVGLDVGYVLVGIGLLLRKTPLQRGFGLAILIQGFFLFFFDLFHALQI